MMFIRKIDVAGYNNGAWSSFCHQRQQVICSKDTYLHVSFLFNIRLFHYGEQILFSDDFVECLLPCLSADGMVYTYDF